MGTSSSATVLVGFEVQHTDFWQERVTKDSFVSCPNGHRGGQAGKFCSDCGGKLDYQRHTKLVATPNFAKWIGDDDPEGKAGEAWNPEPMRCAEEQIGTAFKPFELECADPNDGSEHKCQLRVLALKPLHKGDICGGGGWGDSKTNALGEGDITNLFTQAREFANKLGIDRPVRLYLTTYC